jgi:hypothetical protein
MTCLLPRRTFSAKQKKTRAKLEEAQEEAVLQLPPDQLAHTGIRVVKQKCCRSRTVRTRIEPNK